MKNNSLMVAAGILIVIVGAFWFATPDTPTKTNYGVREYKAPIEDSLRIFKDNYMDECNSDGDIKEYCSCTFDYLDATVTNQRFLEMDRIALENEDYMPTEMADAIFACIYLVE